MEKRTIFKLISLFGIALGGIGTLLSGWADDRGLDMTIDEKIDEKLAARENEENEDESVEP